MDVERISSVMDKFEDQFENLDLTSKMMENAIDTTTSQTMPETQVDGLMSQIADENGLEFESQLNDIGIGKDKQKAKAKVKNVDDNEDAELEARLKKLQGI
eukprot:CAMPEP_0114660472 /NCGR_PEP_ID=MMETSP0191-20121206/20150_1 /TAXON_ID=126664 /ORGANISM="Sorites sp." /LENGTH=100 /DNA_ID=CAMNT_0001889265 /DNA_START=388 /DNA_END=690 /DNA_ORIENTATION=+